MKLYQNIEIPGEELIYIDRKRVHSKFWGKGKWDSFIKPLLPKERGTFIEIGCAEGMFLKMAVDEGFTNVIGIDPHSQRMEVARRFKESSGYPYKLIQQKVDADFDIDQMPLADVVLFSNVHYYFPLHVFMNLIDRLKSRVLYCIVVSAVSKKRSGCTVYYKKDTRGYFHDWQEVKIVEGVEKEGDVAPREGMYSILFKGNLDICDVRKECSKWYKLTPGTKKYKRFAFARALNKFNRRILSGEQFDFEETSIYQCWKEKRPEKSAKWVGGRVEYIKALSEDIQKNGIMKPIYFNHKGKLLDGMHRLSTAHELGYKHILMRKLGV